MKAKPIQLNFSGGVEQPPKLGTPILKPTSPGKAAYMQNVSVMTDVYGNGVALPGPYINNFVGSLSQSVYAKGFNAEFQKLWLGYDQSNTLDCIKTLDTGGTPVFDNTQTVTLASGSRVISDISDSTEYQNTTGSLYNYVTLLSPTATTSVAGVMAFQSNAVQSSFVPLSVVALGGILPILKTQFDGNLYIGNAHKIDKVNPTNPSLSAGTTLNAIGASTDGAVPPEWFITALGEWNGQLVAAVCNTPSSNTVPNSIFEERHGSSKSRLYFFDVANNPTANFKNVFVNSPSHYISVLQTDLSGNLLAFGGVDEGRTTIYQWTGYGFSPIFSYIGDMPRNRHSVCFDAIGRLMWITANGEICRLTTSEQLLGQQEQAGVFEHLGTISGSGYGGILSVLQGAAGEEFIASGGNSGTSSAEVDLISTIQFTGDGAGTDNSKTPLMISGIMDLPQKSIITNVVVSLQKQLKAGEKMEVRLYGQDYPDSGSYTVLGTLDYANDGAVASKQVRSLQYNQDNASIGLAWKATTSSATAPGVIGAEVQYNEISNA